MGKLWKKCTLGIHEARYRSREAEVLEDSVLSRAGKAFLNLFSHPLSPRQEGWPGMIPTCGLDWLQ